MKLKFTLCALAALIGGGGFQRKTLIPRQLQSQ